MSEPQADIQGTATPTAPAAGQQTIPTTPQAASVGETAGGEEGIQIPKGRFDEVSSQLKDAQDKLAKYENVSTDDLLQARSGSKEESKNINVDEKLLKDVNSMKEKFEINEVRTKFEDFDNYAKDMAGFIQKHPNASWESAYKNAKFDDLATQARQEGREDVLQSRTEKQIAQSGTPNVRQAPPSDLSKVDSMLADKGSSLADIEAMLPKG